MFRRLRIAIIVSLSTLLVLAALCVGLFRLAIELLPGYKAEIVAGVEQALGRPVALDHIDLRWRGMGPEVVVNRLRLLNHDGTDSALEIEQASARFRFADLWQEESVLRPESIAIDGLALTLIRDPDGRLRVQNFDGDGGSFDSQQLLRWLFQKGQIEVTNVHIDWLDKQRPSVLAANPQFFINSAELAGTGKKQRLQAIIELPTELGKQLQLDVVASGDPQNWSANFTLNAADVKITAFPQQWLRSGGQVVNGRLDAELWGTVENGRVTDVNGDWLVQGAEWQSANASPLKSWPELKGKAEWRDDGVAWRLALNNLENDGDDFGSIRFELNREAVPQQLYFSADELPIRELASAIVLLPNVDQRIINWLNNAQPQGTGYDFVAKLGLDGNTIVGGSAQIRVSDLKWLADAPVPGVNGVNGMLRWDGIAATLTLGEDIADNSLVVDAPWLFREPLIAQQALAAITLRADGDALAVQLNDIVLNNADVGLRGKARLRFAPAQAVDLWLDMGIDYADMLAVQRYLPVGVLERRPQIIRWLENAFKAGEVTSGSVSFDGPLVPGAVASGIGNFRADLNLANAQLQFQPQWPLVENINASVSFRDASIVVDASRASLLNLDLTQLQASIPDLNKASVILSGNFDSSVDEALEFLRETPLKKRFGQILAGFRTDGRAVGRIEQFDLPLKPPFVPTLSGYLDITDGKLRGPGWRETISNISGRLSFTDKTLRGSKLRGEAIGLVVRGSMATKGKGVVFDLGGSIKADWVQARLGLPEPLIDGQLRWDGDLQLGNGAPRWSFSSDTRGMALNVPAPLGKTAGEARRLVIHSDEFDSRQLVVALEYEQWLQTRMRWLQADNSWLFDAAVVRLGGQAPQLRNDMNGIYVNGSLANVDAAPWVEMFTGEGGVYKSSKPNSPLKVKELNLYFNQLRYRDAYLRQQSVNWMPTGDGWRLQLGGADINGSVQWFNERLLAVNLKSLRIRPPAGSGKKPSGKLPESPPQSLPTVQFACDDCWYGDIGLGAVSFIAQQSADGVAVSELNIASPTLQVTGSASWERSAYGPRTLLRTTASTQSLLALLAQFSIVDSLDAKNTTFRSNLSWPGGPGDFSLARLSGDAAMELDEGRIYKVDSDAAKVIGLLSLDMLPQRLSMNFDDVVKPGFAFDSIEGNFVLNDGNAVTDNLVIDGPSAKITVTGRTGLRDRDYDQKIKVNPKLGGGVTIAGALLGGTGVGAVLLLGQELLDRPFDAVTGLKYNVTGSWDNPQITSPKIAPGDIKTGPRGRRN